jgi:hypothetical protein
VGSRYVSKERLQAMLNSEWGQLLNQLTKSRGSKTRFFAFVDTISARNYAGTNDPEGWVGLRFQLQPGGEANQIILHINMRDNSNPLEQEAIGILGVNLIDAVFYRLQQKDAFLANLADGIEGRIEIDYIEVTGPDFAAWDQRTMLIELVRGGLAEAVCFLCGRPLAPPSEVLHRKAVVLAPGTFEHVNSEHAAIHHEMLASGVQQLHGELGQKEPAPSGFFCISVTPLNEGDPSTGIPELLERVDALHTRGGDVMLFREQELYYMTDLVNRYTKEHVRFVVGLSLLIRVWEHRYKQLPGGFLEALSRLLAQNVRIYAHPMTFGDLEQSMQSISATDWQWTETNGWVSASQLHPPLPLRHLYDYILASDFLVPLQIPVGATAGA